METFLLASSSFCAKLLRAFVVLGPLLGLGQLLRWRILAWEGEHQGRKT
jgi:hypothetical protein